MTLKTTKVRIIEVLKEVGTILLAAIIVGCVAALVIYAGSFNHKRR